MTDGSARSVISVESTIAPGLEPAITTRQGVTQGKLELGVVPPRPLASPGSGNATRYKPSAACGSRCIAAYEPHTFVSMSSAQWSLGVRNSAGIHQPAVVGDAVPATTS